MKLSKTETTRCNSKRCARHIYNPNNRASRTLPSGRIFTIAIPSLLIQQQRRWLLFTGSTRAFFREETPWDSQDKTRVVTFDCTNRSERVRELLLTWSRAEEYGTGVTSGEHRQKLNVQPCGEGDEAVWAAPGPYAGGFYGCHQQCVWCTNCVVAFVFWGLLAAAKLLLCVNN